MKKQIGCFALCAALIGTGTGAFAATPLSVLAPAAHDQVPAHILAAHSPAQANDTLERSPVQFSRPLDSAQALAPAAQPFIAHSREYWSDVGESELRAGVKFSTSAPGALIRLSPQGGAFAALDPADIIVRHNGRALNAADASVAVADTHALRQAGMDLPAGSLAFRLAPASGSGDMEIAASHAQGRYLMHVYEPESTLELNLGADRDTVLVGTTIRFHATLDDAGAAGRLALASGLVSAPDGYSADLHFVRNADGSFDAAFTPEAAHDAGPQLWEAHIFTITRPGGTAIRRDATTAFAVSAPTARFSGAAQYAAEASGLQVSLGIASASASRYQVSAVLYASGSDGVMHPAALAQSAAWLDPGEASIALHFDNSTLGAGGLHAPYELRDVRLTDQATMAVIERRTRALVID